MSPVRTSVKTALGLGALAASALTGVTTGAAAGTAPTCHGRTATIVGDREYVEGTSGDDVIYAPNSEVHAFEGDDDICAAYLVYAGPGNDVVTVPGGGDTEVQGDGGNDRIIVGRGYADIRGGFGNDEITTGKGQQLVNGGPGRDRISAGPGKDYVAGDDGADVLRGGAGEDTLVGGRGADELHGGSADDELYGGRGQDTGYGGPGKDSCERGVEERHTCHA